MPAVSVAQAAVGKRVVAPAGNDLLALAERAQQSGATESASGLLDEARIGVERLARMTPDQLRKLIADRVHLLETELREREARRAAIEEAMAAQRVLEARRLRARAIRRKVNIGSSLAAAMFAGLAVIGMF